jgi:16S rRNA (uracil1498-N3)-methyltransferase
MRLHRFHTNIEIGDKNELFIDDYDVYNQIIKVFRYKIGDKVVFFDNSGFDYECILSKIDKKALFFNIEDKKNGLIPNKNISLCFSLVKKDNAEMIIQKAVELGVSHIYPVITERSEKKDLNMDRIKKIITEATEQSGWSKIPDIHDISDLRKIIDITKDHKRIAFDTKSTQKVDQNITNESSVVIFIGPEGGWTDSEIDLFKENNVGIYSLGCSVLRAETAVIVALAKII